MKKHPVVKILGGKQLAVCKIIPSKVEQKSRYLLYTQQGAAYICILPIKAIREIIILKLSIHKSQLGIKADAATTGDDDNMQWN